MSFDPDFFADAAKDHIKYDNTGSDRKINSSLFTVKSNKKNVFLNFTYILFIL